jgi:hypothetical protein
MLTMPAMETTIEVVPGSELDRRLAEADGTTIVLVRNGRRVRVVAEDALEDIWAGYDPERVLRALDETAGSWADIDADALIAHIYRWCEEGSRSPERG